MQGQPLQIVVLSAVVTAALACAPDDQHPLSILQEDIPTVSLIVKSASSEAALSSAEVELLERVLCEQAPCPPRVAWRGRTNGRGVVRIPRERLRETTQLRVPGLGAREVGVSGFVTDIDAWTLYLVPDGSIACGTTGDQWTVRVARDGRSAEIREHDRSLEYGVLRCSRDGADLPQCYNTDVMDAGYVVSLSRTGGALRAQIGRQSKGGVHPLADQNCREGR